MLSWQFLAPLKAHNRADGAAGHLKKVERTLVSGGFIISEISQLAFAAWSLTNATMIEVDFESFQGLLIIHQNFV